MFSSFLHQFLYPLKTSEKQRFSDIFRVYETNGHILLETNGSISTKWVNKLWDESRYSRMDPAKFVEDSLQFILEYLDPNIGLQSFV